MLYVVRGILTAASAEADHAVHRVLSRAPISQITLRVFCTSCAVSSCCLTRVCPLLRNIQNGKK